MENTNTILFKDDQATFFLADGDGYKGPFKPSEIYSMIEAKEVSWVDYCYREQEGEWVRIADHEIFKAIRAAEPPKPKPKVTPPPPPAEKTASISWFIFQNDTQTGPYSTADISRLLTSGQVQSSAFAWQETFSEWRPLHQIPDFKSVAPPPTPEQKKEEDRRYAPRKPLVAQTYLTNQKDVITGLCRDISVGGMQVLCETVPAKVGETLRLNVLPPDTSGLKAFVAEGVVVRILEDKKGFSFRFTRVSEEAKEAIERYIS